MGKEKRALSCALSNQSIKATTRHHHRRILKTLLLSEFDNNNNERIIKSSRARSSPPVHQTVRVHTRRRERWEEIRAKRRLIGRRRKREKEDVLPLRRAFARRVEEQNARVFIRFNGVRVVLLRRDRWFLFLVLVKDDFDVEGRWCRFGKRTTAKSTPSARDDGDDRKRSRSEDFINVDEQ